MAPERRHLMEDLEKGTGRWCGRTILHYQVLEKLGQGGMGVVYKARDLKLDRLVALKLLSLDLLDSEDARIRFKREAFALSALNHPNIATIFSVEDTGEEPFLVLEYLPGGTLRSQIRRIGASGRRMPVEQVLEYALQIGGALAHAHRREIVHRDVKTANVLVGAEGRLKVTDFGLATFRGIARVTDPGRAVGTAAYMSPEQACGRAADERSDIFSFGVVLYEMAAGELPFQGEQEQAALYQVVHAAPRPLGEIRPDAPAGLDAFMDRVLAKDPADRYQRMEDALGELRRLRATDDGVQDAEYCQSTVTMRPQRAPRGRRWPVFGLICLLTMLGAGLVFRPAARDTRVAVPAERRIAVIPFTNIGGDASSQAFCDGVVESLTSSLTELERFQGALRVVPASEVRRQSIASVLDAQRSFGINLAITGSVQRTGGRVRLTVNLVDPQRMVQLGARSLDIPRGDLTQIEDRLLELVADLLDVQLQPQTRKALSAGRTQVSDAFDLYLEGRGYLRRFDKAGNLESAVAAFREALRSDPRYVLAYAGLAEAYLRTFDRDKNTQWLELAAAADAQAIQINDRFAPTHVNLGMTYAATGQPQKAVVEFQRALNLDPINVEAYRELANAYEKLDRVKDAEATYRRAMQLRPGDWLTNGNLGAFYYRHGRYSDAEPLFRKQIELTPDNVNGYLNLGGLYILTGRVVEAEELLKKSLTVKPSPKAYSNLGTLYYQEGRYQDAVAMYEKAVVLEAGNYILFGNLADSYRRSPEFAPKAPGAYGTAITLAEQQMAINPQNATVLSRLARYRVRSGDRGNALRDIRRAQQLAPADTEVGFNSVLVYEGAGRRAEALAALAELLENHYPFEQVEREPELQQLRQDPRYRRMVSRSQGTNSRSRSN